VTPGDSPNLRVRYSADDDTVRVVLEFPPDVDPDRLADLAWAAITDLVARLHREQPPDPQTPGEPSCRSS
jgi:hypothetical protein